MSREEAKDKEKAEMSDKLRLEMAMKESAEVAEKMMAKHSPNHAMSNQEAPKQPVDPWGAPPVQQNTFDPFSSAKPAAAVATNGFGNDPWGASASAPSQVASEPAVDPWGGSSGGVASVTATTSQSMNQMVAPDPWGAPVNQPTLAAPPTTSSAQKLDPWGSGKPTVQGDPWSSGDTGVVPSDPWGSTAAPASTSASTGLSIGTGDSFDPFASFAPSQSSNPLQNFNQLSLQPSQPSATLDLLSSDVLVPQNANGPGGPNSNGAAVLDNGSNKAGAFLGNNANLVNIDNLITKPAVTHPYITMNTSGDQIGANRNPFAQKGPSLSLNQMKTDTQKLFGGQSAPSSNTIQPSPLPAMGMSLGTFQQVPVAMGGVPQAPVGMQPAANPFFASQPVQMNPGNPPNQLLF